MIDSMSTKSSKIHASRRPTVKQAVLLEGMTDGRCAFFSYKYTSST